jgi:hypothetical protein
MIEHIPTSEICFSARYLHKDLSRQLPEDIVELYLRSIPEEYQETNRKKDFADLQLAAATWRHWIYSCEEAKALGYTVDTENRISGLNTVAIIDSLKVENDYEQVKMLGEKWGFTAIPDTSQYPYHDGKEYFDIESITTWKRLSDTADLVFAKDYRGRPSAPGSGDTTFWASVGVLWAPRHLIEKYQGNADAMPAHLI